MHAPANGHTATFPTGIGDLETFLKAYPFPACVVSEQNTIRSAVVWANRLWSSCNRVDLASWLSDSHHTLEQEGHLLAKTRSASPNLWIITATPISPPPPPPPPSTSQPSTSEPEPVWTPTSSRQRIGARDKPSLFMTPLKQEVDNPDFVIQCEKQFAAVDWSKTSLGPTEQWSPALMAFCRKAFRSRTVDVIWAGPDLNSIYNTAYCESVMHPINWGEPAAVTWEGVWENALYPLVAKCMQGHTLHQDNHQLFNNSGPRGYGLEKYYSWTYFPIFDGDAVIGVYNTSSDTTDHVLAIRRLDTTHKLLDKLRSVTTSEDFFPSIMDVLEQNPADVPFAMAYDVDADSGMDLTLKSSIGIPSGHGAAPPSIRIEHLTASRRDPNGQCLIEPSTETTHWPITHALSSGNCVLVDDCSKIVADMPVRFWKRLPDQAVIIPLVGDRVDDVPHAVLIIGVNVHRTLDKDYSHWFLTLRQTLSHALNSIRAIETETQRQAEMEQLKTAKTMLIQGAAHEFRTPLTMMVGPLEDLLSSPLSAGQKRWLKLALRNVRRLQQIVDTLLDFSRLQAGRLQPKFVRTALGPFVAQVAEVFRTAVERMGLKFIVDVDMATELVSVDLVVGETVISTLISNALQYTKSGSITVRFTYELNDNVRWASLSVIDTGTGIPQSCLDFMQQSYEPSKVSITGDENCVGIAFAREIMRLHGGELSCSFDRGTTFTARFPTSHSDDGEILSDVMLAGYGREAAMAAWTLYRDDDSDGTPLLVSGYADGLLFDRSDVLLVVDHNRETRSYIRMVFAPFCMVLEASDAEEALELLLAKKVHLVLTELVLPTMSGHELLLHLKRDPTTSLIPVILLTGAHDNSAHAEAILAGADNFLLKPFKSRELVAHVHLNMQMGKKRADLERRFAQREKEIKVLSDHCAAGILRTNKAGQVIYANQAYLEPAAVTVQELVHDPRTWHSIIDEHDREPLATLWESLLCGDVAIVTTSWRWKTGRVMMGKFIRLDLVDPTLEGVLVCVTDITEAENRISDAERRRVEAEESRRQQELLVDLTSHEIRTPVSAILQCSSMVKQNLEKLALQLQPRQPFTASDELLAEIEEDLGALESIYQCGLVQERIAADVLSLARIQLDMLSLHDVEMNVRTAAQRGISVFASEAKAKDVTLLLEIGPTFEAMQVSAVKTDPVRVGQIVTNLISNAMRFTDGMETRVIRVRYDAALAPPTKGCQLPEETPPPGVSEDTPVYLYISVSDTGLGMDKKELDIIFKRFHQGNKMIHTRYGGSGLGLFICKKISQLLQGDIEVESEKGKGSTFRFFIKARAMQPGPRPPVVLSPEPQPQPVGLGKLNVLVVEDNKISQTVLKRQIVKQGMHCDVANNGQEALDKMFASKFDVVLMDLEMPVMDGMTAIKHLRKVERTQNRPRQIVIVLTGNARQGHIDAAMEAGADDVMLKPYRLQNLIQRVHEVANAAGLQPEIAGP